MQEKIILTKESGKEDVKKYFTSVLELSKDSEEFPVNLDDVWMLVYGRKEEAVRALTSNEQFIQDVDYKVLRKSAENPMGGRPANDYHLTIPCLEFFIARKVRSVFEVYRKVFHHVAQGMQAVVSSKEDEIKCSLAWVEGVKRILNLSDASALALLKQAGDPLGLPTPDYVKSKGVSHSATELLERNEIKVSAQAFNKLLFANGFIRRETRKGTKGIHKYWVITEKGTTYGEDYTPPQNPKQTQPYWYDDKFLELCREVGVGA